MQGAIQVLGFTLLKLKLLTTVLTTGVLDDVQTYYSINDKEASLVSTAFIISYMLLSPLFGYLGDRYNRTIIMSVGITGWAAVTLASSFVDRQVIIIIIIIII